MKGAFVLNSIYLTGVKPTGTLHIGNYVGSIRSLIDFLDNNKNIDAFIFIADCHALTNQPSPEELSNNTKDLMISYLSIFDTLDNKLSKNNNTITFYRQSKVPEIFELYWILSCYTAKGLLNRNHTYKQETESNISRGKDPDKGVFAGTFNYPILMAADILLFDANFVPVGKDQLQHIEIANDIVDKINYMYNSKILTSATPITDENKYILPGKDGRKMSKSYGNTIPLFSDEKTIRKYVYGIKTNNKGEGDPKFPDESNIADLHRAFSNKNQHDKFLQLMTDGYSWKDLKTITYKRIINEIGKYWIKYEKYKDNFEMVKNRFELHENFIKTRSQNNLNRIKEKIGMGVI